MKTDFLIQAAMKSFESYLLDCLRELVKNPTLIEQGTTQLRSGGKRLRARLLMLLQVEAGLRAEDIFAWAACCEFLHNGTLIHDDIQDQDEVRRGHPSLWAQYGLNSAINTGDVFLMLPYRILGLRGGQLFLRERLELLSRASIALAEGQALEWSLLSDPPMDSFFSIYEQMVRLKTSSLFVLPVQGWLCRFQQDPLVLKDQIEIFNDLGFLFQVMDDLIDYFGEKGRGRPFEDLREGKISVVAATYLDQNRCGSGGETRQKDFLDFLKQPREIKSEREVLYWSQVMCDQAIPQVRAQFDAVADQLRNKKLALMESPLQQAGLWLLDKIEAMAKQDIAKTFGINKEVKMEVEL